MKNKAATEWQQRDHDVMDDTDRDERLAKLKQAQRRHSARGAAVHKLLEMNESDIEDKIAAVKAIQQTDRPRVMSAFSRLMSQSDDKTG